MLTPVVLQNLLISRNYLTHIGNHHSLTPAQAPEKIQVTAVLPIRHNGEARINQTKYYLLFIETQNLIA